jgi:hypothetical protein
MNPSSKSGALSSRCLGFFTLEIVQTPAEEPPAAEVEMPMAAGRALLATARPRFAPRRQAREKFSVNPDGNGGYTIELEPGERLSGVEVDHTESEPIPVPEAPLPAMPGRMLSTARAALLTGLRLRSSRTHAHRPRFVGVFMKLLCDLIPTFSVDELKRSATATGVEFNFDGPIHKGTPK